jgi:predicted ABC-type ATPase
LWRGANGVGKTTFALQFLQEYEDYEFLNADEIAKHLSADAPASKKISAGKIFFQKLKETVAQNKSLLIESTLSGRYLEDYFDLWRENGYQVQIIFIFVEFVDVSIARIAERVIKGGHFVPDNDVIRRFKRGKDNFWQIYKNLADSWSLFYNSENSFIRIAIGEKDNAFIVDQTLFDRFV